MTQNTTQLLLVYIYIDILVHNTAHTQQKDDIENTYIKMYECRYQAYMIILLLYRKLCIQKLTAEVLSTYVKVRKGQFLFIIENIM